MMVTMKLGAIAACGFGFPFIMGNQKCSLIEVCGYGRDTVSFYEGSAYNEDRKGTKISVDHKEYTVAVINRLKLVFPFMTRVIRINDDDGRDGILVLYRQNKDDTENESVVIYNGLRPWRYIDQLSAKVGGGSCMWTQGERGETLCINGTVEFV